MKLHPLILGITLASAVLVVGCDKQNNEVGTPGVNDNNSMSTTDNDPNVNTTVGTEIDDGVITTKVKAAMLADDTVKGLDLDVDTTRGTVRLSGAVDSQTQIDMAVQIAKSVEGVKDVQNELTVKQQ